MMIVRGIIALLAAAALPAMRRVQGSAPASTAANDLRVFAAAPHLPKQPGFRTPSSIVWSISSRAASDAVKRQTEIEAVEPSCW